MTNGIRLRSRRGVDGLYDLRIGGDVIGQWEKESGMLTVSSFDDGRICMLSKKIRAMADVKQFVEHDLSVNGRVVAYRHYGGPIHFFDHLRIGPLKLKYCGDFPDDMANCRGIRPKQAGHRFRLARKTIDLKDRIIHPIHFRSGVIGWIEHRWWNDEDRTRLVMPSLSSVFLHESYEYAPNDDRLELLQKNLKRCRVVCWNRFGRHLYFLIRAEAGAVLGKEQEIGISSPQMSYVEIEES